MKKVWAGVDAGKTHHHCVVIDDQGRRLLSRRVANDEPELQALIADVIALGDVTWAADMPGGGAALLIGLLAAAGQPLLYLPGHTLAHAAAGYRGEGKTPATPRSSPTRPGCAATCSRCGPAIRSPPS